MIPLMTWRKSLSLFALALAGAVGRPGHAALLAPGRRPGARIGA
jgi:hypothetical protein